MNLDQEEAKELRRKAIVEKFDKVLRELAEKEIHYSNWTSQPYVQIYCTKVMEYSWMTGKSLPENVYETVEKLYTFDETLVTCPVCKKIMAACKELMASS
jgi:translation initiation factor 2 beta subunit (eIF-2beta)/eIF-5